MEQKLNTCINLLTKAKELVSMDEPNVDLALDMLENSQAILSDFASLDNSEKEVFKEKLLQIQALGQLINQKLGSEKNKLQQKVLHNSKMSSAVKGYSRG